MNILVKILFFSVLGGNLLKILRFLEPEKSAKIDKNYVLRIMLMILLSGFSFGGFMRLNKLLFK